MGFREESCSTSLFMMSPVREWGQNALRKQCKEIMYISAVASHLWGSLSLSLMFGL